MTERAESEAWTTEQAAGEAAVGAEAAMPLRQPGQERRPRGLMARIRSAFRGTSARDDAKP